MGVVSGLVTIWLTMTLALYLLERLKLGPDFATRPTLFIVALVLALGNALIGPVLIALAIPPTLPLLLLAAFGVDLLLLWASDRLLEPFTVRGGTVVLLQNAALLVIFTQLIFIALSALFGVRV